MINPPGSWVKNSEPVLLKKMARRCLRAIFHFDVEKITSFPEQQEQPELSQQERQPEQQEPAWK
jgi:hypothetical protein